MNPKSTIPAVASPAAGAKEPVAAASERIALDSRRPWVLGDEGRALRIVSGHVDMFAVRMTDRAGEGARHPLFRADCGEIILDLRHARKELTDRVELIAVGAPGAEALVGARERINDVGAIEKWISRLCSSIIGPDADWTVREAETGATIELIAGERVRSPTRGVVWIACESGNIRLMGLDTVCHAGDPPLPLSAGMWIETAGELPAVVRCGGTPVGSELWIAIDRFHVYASAGIRSRLAAAADTEARQLAQRGTIAVVQTQNLFHELATVILPQTQTRYHEEHGDPLLAACQAVGRTTDTIIVRPPDTHPSQQEYKDIVEIARASRLQVRRTLLRLGWWRWSVGPLIAWHGENRCPVALIPTSRQRYSMVGPGAEEGRIVDEVLASELAADAAMIYPKLPLRVLSPSDLFKFCAQHVRGNAGRVFVAVTLMGLLTLAAPLLTQFLVNSVIPRTELDQLAYLAAALAMVAIAMAGLQAMHSIAMLRLEGLLDWRLQGAVVDRLLRLPASFFKQYTVGDLADRTLGINAIRQVATGHVVRGLLAGLFGLFSLGLMFYYDTRLALIACALTAARALLIIAFSVFRLYHERRHAELQGKVEGLVLQLLTVVGKLRVASATIRALAIWANRFASQKRHFTASQHALNVLTTIEAAFPTIATLIVFAVVGSDLTGALALDLGAFLAFFAAFGQTMAAIGELATAIGTSLIAIPYFARVRPLLANAVENFEGRVQPGELSGSIELSQVTFRYVQTGPPILDNISFRVDRGEYVCIVGPSGSGKSTIFRLFLGFESGEAGAVFFDGKSIDTLDISAVRRQIGVVLQNGKLASGSIYENICGGVDLPMARAWEAARLAGFDADIELMPMGMHTAISEGVSTLSGGQRQRLMIARALVRTPRILLFDEATSALDNRTQSIVSASLAKLNVTRIVIAHRLTTVQEADRIIVLVGGRIVQTGTFAELNAAPGMFAQLALRQLL